MNWLIGEQYTWRLGVFSDPLSETVDEAFFVLHLEKQQSDDNKHNKSACPLWAVAPAGFADILLLNIPAPHWLPIPVVYSVV